MTTGFSPHDLERFGIDPGALGERESLPLPRPHVDEARGPARSTTASDAEPPLRVRSHVLDQVGVAATLDEQAPEPAIRLHGPQDVPFDIVPLAPQASPETRSGPADAASPPPHPDVRLPLRESFRFVIAGPGGVPVAIGAVMAHTVEVQIVYAWPAPPLDHWVRQAGDGDMRRLLEETRPADRWRQTVAAGILARLEEPASAAEARTRVADMLAGRSPARRDTPRVWLRALAPSQRTVIEHFATVRARALASRLDQLLDNLSPDLEDAAARWHDACLERDDLESVRVLLREAGGGSALESSLRDVDAPGRAIRFSWPREIVVQDARLDRVAVANPSAWWGSTTYERFLL